MKILLTALNAKYIHSNPAIYSLRAYAGKALQEHIEIAEYTINNQLGEILADIYVKKPDVIAFSCYIWNWNMIQDIIAELPKILPNCPIWLGGPEVSYDALQILEKYPQITGIMIGEGEETFKELAECYVNHRARNISGVLADNEATEVLEDTASKSLEDIPGLTLPSGYTPIRPLTDLDKIPFLYGDSDTALEPFKNRIIYYESSRGCPYSCSYCLSSIDKSVRFRNLDIVKKELKFFLDRKIPQVKFVDRTFNCKHEHAMAIWQYIYDNDNGVTNFHFEVSADILNEEELSLLNKMRPGLVQLEIGVQSTNETTIKEIKRVMDVDKLERIVRCIHEGQNIHAHLDLIAGLPFEDYESFKKSFDRVYAMKPEQLQLGFLKVLKGSYMHDKAEEYKLEYLTKPPYEVLSTAWLSYDDVLRLKKIEEMVEIYYNTNQFTRTIPVLLKNFEGPFAMFEALADYYNEKGYFTNSPARVYRYQVLLDFAKEVDAANYEIYRELLTYDMYLRENLKTRPGFAKDLQPFKDDMRSFYKAEEESRRFLPDYEGYDSKQLSKMTHMEPLMEKDTYVLFDYRGRSPLTGEARTIVLRKIANESDMQDKSGCSDTDKCKITRSNNNIFEEIKE